MNNRQVAQITGSAIVLMAITAFFAVSTYHQFASIQDNSALVEKLASDQQYFRLGIAAWVVILICDLVASWGLYVVFRNDNQALALLSSGFRLIYTAILGNAITYLLIANLAVEAVDIQLYLQAFEATWSYGLIVFGGHLMLLGAVVYKAKAPIIWAILLLIAGVGYLLINTGGLLLPNFETYQSAIEMVFMLPMILGEIGLAIWLIIHGGKE